MTVRPSLSAPLVDKGGRIDTAWIDYLTRTNAYVSPLETDATLADVIAKINEIIAALEAAGLAKKG